jgi:hypothetical protein
MDLACEPKPKYLRKCHKRTAMTTKRKKKKKKVQMTSFRDFKGQFGFIN